MIIVTRIICVTLFSRNHLLLWSHWINNNLITHFLALVLNSHTAPCCSTAHSIIIRKENQQPMEKPCQCNGFSLAGQGHGTGLSCTGWGFFCSPCLPAPWLAGRYSWWKLSFYCGFWWILTTHHLTFIDICTILNAVNCPVQGSARLCLFPQMQCSRKVASAGFGAAVFSDETWGRAESGSVSAPPPYFAWSKHARYS